MVVQQLGVSTFTAVDPGLILGMGIKIPQAIWCALYIYVTWPTKVCLVKAMVFPVVMCGCDSWAIKEAERWRTDTFELWCWRKFLRVPWTARRSNQSVLKEINPGIFFGRTDAEAETPILWPPDAKNWLILQERPWSCERLKAGEGDDRGWDGWMTSSIRWTWVWASCGSW